MTTLEPIQSTLYDDFDDDIDMIHKLICSFVEQTLPQTQQDMHQYFQSNDITSLSNITHAIKGTAGGFGYLPMTDLLLEMENTIASGNMHQLSELIGEFNIMCERIYLGHSQYIQTCTQ